MVLRKAVYASASRQDARAALAAYDSYLEFVRSENERARREAAAAASEAAAGGGAASASGAAEEVLPPPYYYYHSPFWRPDSALVHLSSDVRNSLLYLCAGGDAWDAELAGPEARARRRAASGSSSAAAGAPPPVGPGPGPGLDWDSVRGGAGAAAPAPPREELPPLPAEELARRGREIFDRTTSCLAAVEGPLRSAAAAAAATAAVAASGSASAAAAPAPADNAGDDDDEEGNKKKSWSSSSSLSAPPLSSDGEMSYTALARMAARARDPRGSLEAAREAVSRGYPARLRCFSPAILAFAVDGDARAAFDVEREAREEHALEVTELELGFLANAAAAAFPLPPPLLLLLLLRRRRRRRSQRGGPPSPPSSPSPP